MKTNTPAKKTSVFTKKTSALTKKANTLKKKTNIYNTRGFVESPDMRRRKIGQV